MPAPDYYDLDALLTEEERITRDTVRSFVELRTLIRDSLRSSNPRDLRLEPAAARQ